jgi:hypothetical protein
MSKEKRPVLQFLYKQRGVKFAEIAQILASEYGLEGQALTDKVYDTLDWWETVQHMTAGRRRRPETALDRLLQDHLDLTNQIWDVESDDIP